MTYSCPVPCSLKPVLVLVVAVLTTASGCSKPQNATLSGKVMLDRAPLANGTISFIPADGSTTTAGAPIKDGQYSVEMPPGKKTVQISAMKVVGKRQVYQGDPKSPIIDELRPIEFTSATPLTADVPLGDSQRDFELTSKEPSSKR